MGISRPITGRRLLLTQSLRWVAYASYCLWIRPFPQEPSLRLTRSQLSLFPTLEPLHSSGFWSVSMVRASAAIYRSLELILLPASSLITLVHVNEGYESSLSLFIVGRLALHRFRLVAYRRLSPLRFWRLLGSP